jgi:prepilin-type N-terminal cleavage/methylation domain-containing protein
MNEKVHAPSRQICCQKSSQQGFSLVEISLVLAIIALIIAGIYGGWTMIKNAESNAIASEIEKFRSATQTFVQRYSALPGDYDRAVQTINPNTGIVNGNGNGEITAGGGANATTESVQAWLHLSRAALLEGSFTGQLSGTGAVVLGQNVPESKMQGTGYTFIFQGVLDGTDSDHYAGVYNNVLDIGSVGGFSTNGFTLTPADAYSVDRKIDDGLPGKGNVITYKNNTSATGCVTGTAPDTAQYRNDISSPNPVCALKAKIAFH